MRVSRTCVCGGAIRADPAAPFEEVQAHVRSAQHLAWRRGTPPARHRCPGIDETGCPVIIPLDRERCRYCTRTKASA